MRLTPERAASPAGWTGGETLKLLNARFMRFSRLSNKPSHDLMTILMPIFEHLPANRCYEDGPDGLRPGESGRTMRSASDRHRRSELLS